MPRRSAVLSCSAVLVAFLSAPAAVGKQPAFDACKLLKKPEVAKAIGVPVASAKGGGSATGARHCNWTGQGSGLLRKGITLIAARDHAKTRYAEYRKLMSSPRKVKGIGDAAATDGEVLIARKGDNRFVYISPLYSRTGIGLDVLKPLAAKALARIR
jgi:hypothetical protein